MAAKNNEIFEEWQTMKITQDFLEVEGNQNANEKTESYLALVMAILVLSGEKFPSICKFETGRFANDWFLSVYLSRFPLLVWKKIITENFFYGQSVEHIFFQDFFHSSIKSTFHVSKEPICLCDKKVIYDYL